MVHPASTDSGAGADTWTIDHAFSLPEVWCLVAAFSVVVGAWRLMGVCRASRVGVRGFLGTLPRFVVCGGLQNTRTEAVHQTYLATLQWKAMPALLYARYEHACCTVRGALVVLGGNVKLDGGNRGVSPTSRVEKFAEAAGAFASSRRCHAVISLVPPQLQSTRATALWVRYSCSEVVLWRFA